MAGATGLEPATSGVTGRRSKPTELRPRGPRPVAAVLPLPPKGVKYTRRRARDWWAMRDSNPRPPRCKRDALPAELIAPAASPSFADACRFSTGGRRQFSESRSPLPGLNLACFDAAILIFSPVRGFRPSEAAREDTENVPKPTSRTSSPPFSASAIASNTASTALLASVFLSSVLPATESTSSFLFTGSPPERVCWIDAAYSPESLERTRRRVNHAADKESKRFRILQGVSDAPSQSASEAICDTTRSVR